MNLKNLQLIIYVLTVIGLSRPCLASNALRGKAFNSNCKYEVRKEFNVGPQQILKEESAITHEDVAKIIPTQFSEDESSQQLVSRILQNSANAVLNSPMIQSSFLMKKMKKVEKATQLEVAIKEEKPSQTEEQIQHQFKFDLQALQGMAKMTYSGYIQSKLEYQTNNNTLLVSVEESLSAYSKLTLSHTTDNQQSRQLIQYHLIW